MFTVGVFLAVLFVVYEWKLAPIPLMPSESDRGQPLLERGLSHVLTDDVSSALIQGPLRLVFVFGIILLGRLFLRKLLLL